MLVLGLVILSLFSNVLGAGSHEHVTYTWQLLEYFDDQPIIVPQFTVWSLPVDSILHCGVIDGKLCSFPGVVRVHDNHIEYVFDVESPFYAFIDTFYLSRAGTNLSYTIKVLSQIKKVKMLNAICSDFDPVLKLPYGTKIYHDADMTIPADIIPCVNSRYFIKYCPGGFNAFCIREQLRVRDFNTFKGKKARANSILSVKNEL